MCGLSCILRFTSVAAKLIAEPEEPAHKLSIEWVKAVVIETPLKNRIFLENLKL